MTRAGAPWARGPAKLRFAPRPGAHAPTRSSPSPLPHRPVGEGRAWRRDSRQGEHRPPAQPSWVLASLDGTARAPTAFWEYARQRPGRRLALCATSPASREPSGDARRSAPCLTVLRFLAVAGVTAVAWLHPSCPRDSFSPCCKPVGRLPNRRGGLAIIEGIGRLEWF